LEAFENATLAKPDYAEAFLPWGHSYHLVRFEEVLRFCKGIEIDPSTDSHLILGAISDNWEI